MKVEIYCIIPPDSILGSNLCYFAETRDTVRWSEQIDDAADGVPEAADGSLGSLTQMSLQLGEGILDRVEVRTVRRQVEKAGVRRRDHLPHSRPLMARQIVHDDDVARPQVWNEDLVDIGLESVAVDRPVQHPRRDHAARREGGDKSRGLPVAMGHADAQAFAAPATAMRAGHLRRGPGLVDEDEAVRVEIDLPSNEAPRDRNLSFDVSRRSALPISVDSGNLGPHKGRHLVEFA